MVTHRIGNNDCSRYNKSCICLTPDSTPHWSISSIGLKWYIPNIVQCCHKPHIGLIWHRSNVHLDILSMNLHPCIADIAEDIVRISSAEGWHFLGSSLICTVRSWNCPHIVCSHPSIFDIFCQNNSILPRISSNRWHSCRSGSWPNNANIPWVNPKSSQLGMKCN